MYSLAIIDDNSIVLESIEKSVNWTALNCAVCGTAGNGKDGFDMIKAKRPDIVIIDIMMPGMTGLEVIKMLKESLPNTRFIVITGYNNIEYTRRSIRLGIFDYIVKPVSNDELLSVVRDAIDDIENRKIKLSPENEQDENTLDDEISEIKNRAPDFSAFTREVLIYIDENILNDISLKKTAEYMQISPAYLSNIFKKETGKTFVDYITIIKMCKAKAMLKNPRNKVYEVGQMLGFKDYSYFYQVFKKYSGHAPGSEKHHR